jgi:hypothetical protein
MHSMVNKVKNHYDQFRSHDWYSCGRSEHAKRISNAYIGMIQ